MHVNNTGRSASCCVGQPLKIPTRRRFTKSTQLQWNAPGPSSERGDRGRRARDVQSKVLILVFDRPAGRIVDGARGGQTGFCRTNWLRPKSPSSEHGRKEQGSPYGEPNGGVKRGRWTKVRPANHGAKPTPAGGCSLRNTGRNAEDELEASNTKSPADGNAGRSTSTMAYDN